MTIFPYICFSCYRKRRRWSSCEIDSWQLGAQVRIHPCIHRFGCGSGKHLEVSLFSATEWRGWVKIHFFCAAPIWIVRSVHRFFLQKAIFNMMSLNGQNLLIILALEAEKDNDKLGVELNDIRRILRPNVLLHGTCSMVNYWKRTELIFDDGVRIFFS